MKKASIIFITIFLMIITLPFIFLDRKSTISEKENRNLAVFPKLINEGYYTPINTIPKLIDNYINDRFRFKGAAVSLANLINKNTKIIIGNAVIGKNNWLFYSNPNDGNNINDFFKINHFTDDEINSIIKNIEDRLNWCIANDIKFYFLIPPNKHNVYPEYYPFTRPGGINRTEQLINALPDNLIDVVLYPLNEIIQNKSDGYPLYYETDTHWNMAGARYAFELILSRIKKDFPYAVFPDFNFTTDLSYDSSGDIVPMAGFTSYGIKTIPNVQPVEGWEAYYQYTRNDGRNGITALHYNETLPKAIIFRDSFGIALEPFTSGIFSEVDYIWRRFNPNEKENILQKKPDVIIWQVVERSISNIENSMWE